MLSVVSYGMEDKVLNIWDLIDALRSKSLER